MVSCKKTAEEVLFKWSHHRILSTDSNVRTTLHVFIIASGSGAVTYLVKMLPTLGPSFSFSSSKSVNSRDNKLQTIIWKFLT